jgi:hypothetical protein
VLRGCSTSARRTRVRSPKTDGFVELFSSSDLGGFFRRSMRDTLYRDVDSLQAELEASLHDYNYERPRLGYRNPGRRPWDTIRQFASHEA